MVCQVNGVTRKHTNDGDIVLGSLELPEGNVDSDTTLTLGLQLVKHPGVLEGTLAKFGGFLCMLLANARVGKFRCCDDDIFA